MSLWIFTIPGPPTPLNRPRAARRNGLFRMYDSQKNQKNEVIKILKNQFPRNPLSSCLRVSMDFYHQPSKSDKEANLKLWNINKNSCQDIDNLIKFYLDCGNNLIWKDDRQICILESKKMFSKNPCTTIKVDIIDLNLDERFMSVLKIFSPKEIEKFVSEAHSLPIFNAEFFDRMSDQEKIHAIQQMTTSLTRLSENWTDKLKKINKRKKILY